ncbi:hypothetical protein [Bradyrhizobium neotropicale]|uniref:hypothetical protein n=1 Tax=Bradyrhizobium neotropicale TaxID=1497615 RepID=UPI001AD61EC1|nr:hypothetical protein [Bradyrhizobium neotropicale]MBO4228172.1 hypothetical protein [Bradyrhizobium neotropicale]
MSEIFISHAVADSHLAKLLLDFMKKGMGVPKDSIFCSSVDGHNIPLAEDFNAYIKNQMELGAAWVQSSKSLPIVVPPVAFDVVTKTLGLKQAWKIDATKGLIDLKNLIQSSVSSLEKRSEHVWEEKRAQWGADLKKALSKLQQATKVDAATHKEALSQIKESEDEIERLREALTRAKDRYEELAKLKDKKEVAALEKNEPGNQNVETQFEELIEAVKNTRPSGYKVVDKHIILDHYGRAGTIDWYGYKEEFQDARKYGLLAADSDHVDWSRNKVKVFVNAIKAVEEFLASEEGSKWRKQQDDEVPTDPDDLEFWEYYLEI